MRVRGYLVVATLAAVATAAACTLNPQPLPPGDEERNAGDEGPGLGGGFGLSDSGTSQGENDIPPAPGDAGKDTRDAASDGAADGAVEGGSDGGDAGADADAGS